MIRHIRVAWWSALAAGLAWLCIGSLFDRLAAQGLLVAGRAAPAFGGAVLAARAEQAWRSGDLAAAERLSRAAVARRPIDAATLRLAGSIALARGYAARGEALMRVAGAAGWRDRETQIYWAQAAVEQGAFDVAVERAEALARLGSFVELRALLRQIEANPAGRAALLRRWAEDGDWLTSDYQAWPRGDAAAMANRYLIVSAMRPLLDPQALRRLASPLVEADHIDWAFALIRPNEQTLAFSPSGWSMPLDWNVSAAAGLDAMVNGEGASLHVQARRPALLPLASRLIRLAPGTTRMNLATEGARTDLPLIATITCVKGAEATATPVAAGRDRSSFDLVVPPGCPAQWLRLAVAGDEARRGADFLLYAPTLSRVGAAP